MVQAYEIELADLLATVNFYVDIRLSILLSMDRLNVPFSLQPIYYAKHLICVDRCETVCSYSSFVSCLVLYFHYSRI